MLVVIGKALLGLVKLYVSYLLLKMALKEKNYPSYESLPLLSVFCV